MEKNTKQTLLLIFCPIALVLLFAVYENTGASSSAQIPQFSAVVNQLTQFIPMPAHLGTQQMMDWSRRCDAGGASVTDCQRLRSMITAKVQACRSRMDIRDWLVLGTQKDKSAEHLLFYCDQRFPDLR